MAHEEKTPEEERFWEEFHRALDAAGNPPIAKISRDVTENLGEDLPASSLREWISLGRVPRDHDKLVRMMRAIGAEKQCDWEDLRERAQIARDKRLRPASNLSDAATAETEPVASTTERQPPARDPDETPPEDPGTPPRRFFWWWVTLGAAAAAAAAVVTVIVLTSSDDPDAAQAAETTSPTTASRGKNTPCRPPDGADRAPTASAGTPPTAYAKGGTGRVELIQERRELVVFDSMADGCAVIVTAKADGAVIGTWASTLGKTGRVKKGVPTPPKHISDVWPTGTANIDLRACYGEVLDGEILFEESACGDWVAIRLDS